ncbi:PD-(D/E)XK nuclease family protein [Mangrovimonas spongiae]|uniref:PD-(D/E)XK nuclease family protein n=1 Tax=Mangrovimonas spongiae TaxID=2494697 RepID=A0A3R9NR14_9FLAO|nr:PD-(D/E)XK nuclease family protein [Mangrovimonas spongiae]RSK41608.1 PD-(D/E)XK nuclease family protein [Mangrovimonas spongiae]
MTTTFLEDIIIDLKQQGRDISKLTFVLPSKRAGVFLKNTLNKHIPGTFFSPEIISIEEFVEQISNLEQIPNTELFFEFYRVYLDITPKEDIEPFDRFFKWAQIIIQDFNEIDRYLIEPNNIFDYLTEIKKIEHNHWSIEANQTPYIKSYLSFWNRLKLYYQTLTKQLISKQKGYQGLVYREASNNLKTFVKENTANKYIFAGFNALNKAEEIIIQELLNQGLANIYWDIDAHFINNNLHDAGYFIRSHTEHWNILKKQGFNWKTNHYRNSKHINITGTPKNVGQIKYIGNLLEKLSTKNELKNTAVVLGDESLLIPLINSLPENISAINITMGLPLHQIPLASLFEKLFGIYKSKKPIIYYKEIVNILSHEYIRPLLWDNNLNHADVIIEHIQTNNIVSLSVNELVELAPQKKELLTYLFKTCKNVPKEALQNCKKIILSIKTHLNNNKSSHLLALEYLYRFNEVFNSLEQMMAQFNYIETVDTLYSLYKELIKNDTLDFHGEPLQGLQIMGMLESRVLDFDTVIIASVNEGILPAGKTQNSFIPFDVKLENNLPTYKEKDAVYTYHFYRLLQRATNVHIVYNTEPDVLNGGEKSRFITQLEIDKIHNVNSSIVTSPVPSVSKKLLEVEKNNAVLNRLKDIAKKGFSPSALTNYIRNPIDFYSQKILGIKEFDDVEETVAANTLGTTIHNTLEDLYKPLINQELTEVVLKDLKSKVTNLVSHHIKNEFKSGDITTGINLIIFEIAKRYVNNFINLELNQVKNGNSIKIIAVEASYKVPLHIPELDFPVHLTGMVDRVDEFNGITRVIDYKSGKVEPSKVKIKQWEDLTTDYDKYSKSFQILAYAYMMNHNNPFEKPIQAGIISFKNLGQGFMSFHDNKNNLITQDTLDNYFQQLKQLILKICNPNSPFVEKEIH